MLADASPPITDGNIVILIRPEGNDSVVHICRFDGTPHAGTIRLGGARRAVAHLQDDYLIVADDRGRVLLLRRATWHVVRELRLSL